MTAKVSAHSNAWIWTLLRGIIALVLGIFLIAGGDTATTTTAYVLAAYLAIVRFKVGQDPEESAVKLHTKLLAHPEVIPTGAGPASPRLVQACTPRGS